MRHHQQLFPPLHETAAQTAPRVRRRLRERWPHATFLVRADALRQHVTVSWTGAPEAREVEAITRPHCSVRGPSDGTLWASERGTLSVVVTGAIVLLEHDGQPAIVDADEPPF